MANNGRRPKSQPPNVRNAAEPVQPITLPGAPETTDYLMNTGRGGELLRDALAKTAQHQHDTGVLRAKLSEWMKTTREFGYYAVSLEKQLNIPPARSRIPRDILKTDEQIQAEMLRQLNQQQVPVPAQSVEEIVENQESPEQEVVTAQTE